MASVNNARDAPPVGLKHMHRFQDQLPSMRHTLINLAEVIRPNVKIPTAGRNEIVGRKPEPPKTLEIVTPVQWQVSQGLRVFIADAGRNVFIESI